MKRQFCFTICVTAKAACGLFLLALLGCYIIDKAEAAVAPRREATKTAPHLSAHLHKVSSYLDPWERPPLQDRVFFANDSSALHGEQQVTTLDNWVKFLNAYPNYKLLLKGYCDEHGTRKYNLALGQRRAEAIRDYLVAHGIAPSRLRTTSYGKDDPRVLGSNPNAWAQNRTVVGIPD